MDAAINVGHPGVWTMVLIVLLWGPFVYFLISGAIEGWRDRHWESKPDYSAERATIRSIDDSLEEEE